MSDEALKDDFVIPFGVAKVEREGNDITLVGLSKSVELCLQTAQELEKQGISAEVSSFATALMSHRCHGQGHPHTPGSMCI